jgi:two-component system, LytTR family, sensor kinase
MDKLLRYKHPLIGFNDIPFIIFGIPLVSVLVTMIFFGLPVNSAVACSVNNLVPAYISTAIFWIGDRWITIRMRKIFPFAHQTMKRLWIQGTLIVIYTAIMAYFLQHNKDLFDHSHLGIPLQHPSYMKSFVACMFATVPISAIYEAGYYIHHWKKSIAETERLAHTSTRSQLEALRNQVNPHFLFNSLNTLASIIPDQPENAVQFTLKLSHVYRSILDIRDKQAVTVEEELAFLENYIYLCKTRFDKSITFEISISDEARKQFLVPLTLQMLLENAIKHNIVSQRKPLHVQVYNEGNNFICMRNNVQEKSTEVEGTGTGIRNIRERYMLTFGLPVVIEHSAEAFIAKLPIISIHDYSSTHH